MNTLTRMNHILMILGNLGGLVEGTASKLIAYTVEHEWDIMMIATVLFLLILLIFKGLCPIQERNNAPVSRETGAFVLMGS